MRAALAIDACPSCGDAGDGALCAACVEYEGAEQRAADRTWVDRVNARTRALLVDRVPGAPF
jgi:hypothetical protein